MLERRGATVQHAPALRIVPLADDTAAARGHPGADRAAAGHHRRHHRHRVPRLGRRRRRLGPGRGAPARAGFGRADRARPEGAGGDPGDGAGGRVVAAVGVVGRGAGAPARARGRGAADRGAAARRAAAGRRRGVGRGGGRGRRGAGVPVDAADRHHARRPAARRRRRRARSTSCPSPARPPRRACWPGRASGRCSTTCCGRCAGRCWRSASGRSRRRRWRRWTCRPCSPNAPGSAPWCGGWRPRCPPAPGGCRWPGTGWSCAGTRCSSTVTCAPVAPAGMALLRALARRPGRVVARAELCGRGRRRARVEGDRPPARGARGAEAGADRRQAGVPARARPGGRVGHCLDGRPLRARGRPVTRCCSSRTARATRPGRRSPRRSPSRCAGCSGCGSRCATPTSGTRRPPRRSRSCRAPVVAVPMFLAAGYHVRVDVPAQLAATGRADVLLAETFGPDPALVAAAASRLRAAGLRDGDAVVLAAIGSSDPYAQADGATAARLLARELRAPVTLATIAMGGLRVPDAVARLRADGAGGWPSRPGSWRRGCSSARWWRPGPTWSPSRWPPTKPWPSWWWRATRRPSPTEPRWRSGRRRRVSLSTTVSRRSRHGESPFA